MSRADVRSMGSNDLRIRLLEDDADQFERQLAEGIAEMRKGIADNRKIMVGILVSLATAALLLAVNIAIITGKS